MVDTFRTPLSILDYFALLIASEASMPLSETAASIAQIEYPHLCLCSVANDIDQIAQRIHHKLKKDILPLKKIGGLNHFFYKELKFRAQQSKHDVDLLCINMVLKTRRGADIILAIIYIEIARALGLQARGIRFPGSFLVKIRIQRHNGTAAEVVIDPKTGHSLNISDIHTLLTPFKKQHGLVDEFDIPTDLFFRICNAQRYHE